MASLPIIILKLCLFSRFFLPLPPSGYFILGLLPPHSTNLFRCLKGQTGGLITDLPGLYIHGSTTSPPAVSMKDCLLAWEGAPMHPWSWLKHGVMGVIYCMNLVHVCCVLFMCVYISRTFAPTGFRSHSLLILPFSGLGNGSRKGMKRKCRAKMAVISFLLSEHVIPLAWVNSWLKFEDCWHTLRSHYTYVCMRACASTP